MYHSLPAAAPPRAGRPGTPVPVLFLLLFTSLIALLLYRTLHAASPPAFPVEVTSEDVFVEWIDDGGPNFDPWDRCPDDFFSKGFVLMKKRLADGTFVSFLYHRGRKLLYRIDKDIIRNRVSIGLHWVTSARFGAKYRLADPTFKGGKAVASPNGRNGTTTATYQYGQPVSKRKKAPKREFFAATHIGTEDNCSDWFDLFNLTP